MICVSITNPTPEGCAQVLHAPGLQMAEIRLDTATLSAAQVRVIFSTSPVPLIATCRPTPRRDEAARLEMLLNAMEAGAAYVDVEVETAQKDRVTLFREASHRGCKTICSFHNYQFTPSHPELQDILRACLEDGADIAKIACLVRHPTDCARLLAMYGWPIQPYPEFPYPCRQLVVLGMGALGKITRVAAPFLGAPFTFAALEAGLETAPGQLTRDTLETIQHLLT